MDVLIEVGMWGAGVLVATALILKLGRPLVKKKEDKGRHYFGFLAEALGISEDEIMAAVANASGKTQDAIKPLFAEGSLEKYAYFHPVGFMPVPGQDVGHARINRWGLRGREIGREKPKGVKRVLLLGGSVAWGRGATGDSATISSRLEHYLNQAQDKRGEQFKWQVINGAIPSSISRQELLILVQQGLSFNPDIVLSFNGYNDAHHALDCGELNMSKVVRNLRPASSETRPQGYWEYMRYRISRKFKRLVGMSPDGGDTSERDTTYTIW